MLDVCREAGVTTIDTADVYSFGAAEEILGEALEGRRDDFVLVTKALHAHGARAARRRAVAQASDARVRGQPAPAAHRLSRPLHLPSAGHARRRWTRRCGRSTISSRQGKVRYVGCSNHSAWQVMKALAVSERLGLTRYVCQQVNYSLIARDVEHEIIPLGLDQGVGLMAWSPLHAGLLTGKFRRDVRARRSAASTSSRRPGTIDFERVYRIVDVLLEIAQARGVSASQVALNWVMSKPGVDTVIIGARDEAQLRDNLAAAAWRLSAEEMTRLDEVSALPGAVPDVAPAQVRRRARIRACRRCVRGGDRLRGVRSA